MVDFDRYLAYPEVLPDAFMQATFKMFLPTDTPGTPVSKKSSGKCVRPRQCGPPLGTGDLPGSFVFGRGFVCWFAGSVRIVLLSNPVAQESPPHPRRVTDWFSPLSDTLGFGCVSGRR